MTTPSNTATPERAEDGGPAFPCAQSQQTYLNQDGAPYQAGMTLRDWFAGQIMASAMTNAEGVAEATDDLLLGAARQAYRVADAMLKARSAPINDGEA